MGLFSDGYDAFDTDERDFNDGEESCKATVDATIGGVTTTFHGDTKNLHGHAEMDALYQFLKSIRWDPQTFRQATVTVTCLAKPCCKYCAAVLGSLGVTPTNGTFKVNKSMGISYALHPEIRTFLKKFHGTTEQKILDEFTA